MVRTPRRHAHGAVVGPARPPAVGRRGRVAPRAPARPGPHTGGLQLPPRLPGARRGRAARALRLRRRVPGDVRVELESADQPEVVRLIDELDAFQKPLYPAESHHGIDLAALLAPGV